MKTSEKGLKFISGWEGIELKPYKDAVGLWTIGIGHLITAEELKSGKILINGELVSYKNGITLNQALWLKGEDLSPKEKCVNSLVKVSLEQHQFDALVSLVFNIGEGAFKNSTILKLVNQGKYSEVGSISDKGIEQGQFVRWNKAGGRVIKGLDNRRRAETRLWATGSYS